MHHESGPAVVIEPPNAADADYLAGWPLDPRERGDFYHRPRVFPHEVTQWRRRLARLVVERPRMFPSVPLGATEEEVRQRIDDGISHFREVARILAAAHGTPDLGNKSDPVDELVYIILARKTREEAYQRTFDALKGRFASWDELLEAPREEVATLIRSGGFSERKTASLYGALSMIRERFGSCTLEPVRAWPDEDLEAFLCSLPEISRKSAYCVMMYALRRQVFPVDTHVGRVLSRLAPFRELGLTLHGLDHKKLQVVLADLVPPPLRHSLHVNLVVHGRSTCLSRRPLCGSCDIRKFCASYRSAEVTRVAERHLPTVVDLFAGAGGLSAGFRRAGFRIVAAADSDPLAARTYRLNHPDIADDHLLLKDLRHLAKGYLRPFVGKRLDVLVAAPPCQGFSHAGFRSKRARTGYRLTRDQRNDLFREVVAAALELRPKLLLMENVPGMQSAKRHDVSYLEAAARMLRRKGGFRTALWRLNAAAFGVPQDRIRYFLVASRTGSLPSAPLEEYQDIHRPGFDPDALPPVTLNEAIFDLPGRKAGTGTGVDRAGLLNSDTSRHRRYLLKFGLLSSPIVLYNHSVRFHNERDLELYRLLSPGEDSVHAIERHGRRDLMRYRRDVFDDKYYRLRPDRPCKTIVSHLAKDGNAYIHPHQARSITIREAARVQSFPDDYNTRHFARDTATFSRLREKRNSKLRGTSSALDVAIE
jgi:DNA (cytosine-5)-methyltransferase 1